MSPLRFPLTVILQRTKLVNRWADARWEPIEVWSDTEPTSPDPILLADDAKGTRWRFGGHFFELHPSEAEGYYLNITSPDPKVFVMWRLAEGDAEPGAFPVLVTVSYNQAARMLDGGEQVDAVAMPSAIMMPTKSFVALHYKPEVRKKVRRNDPFRDQENRRGGEPLD